MTNFHNKHPVIFLSFPTEIKKTKKFEELKDLIERDLIK